MGHGQRAVACLAALAAGAIWAQAPGAPGRATKKTGKQAERDDRLWRKPVLPPPPSQDPWPTDPQRGIAATKH
jgi:hypothetical protein